MTGFDFVVLTVILASVVLGMVRGLVREVLALLAYAAAFLAAVWWGPVVNDVLASLIQNNLLRLAIAYVGVFLGVLLIIGVVSLAVSGVVRSTGLAPADRGLGAMFGLARGILLVLVLVVAAGYTPLPAESWWRQAWLSHAIEQGIIAVKHRLPEAYAHWVPYPYTGVPVMSEPSSRPQQASQSALHTSQ